MYMSMGSWDQGGSALVISTCVGKKGVSLGRASGGTLMKTWQSPLRQVRGALEIGWNFKLSQVETRGPGLCKSSSSITKLSLDDSHPGEEVAFFSGGRFLENNVAKSYGKQNAQKLREWTPLSWNGKSGWHITASTIVSFYISPASLRYNRHAIKCTYLECTQRCILTYVYVYTSPYNITVITTPKTSCPFVIYPPWCQPPRQRQSLIYFLALEISFYFLGIFINKILSVPFCLSTQHNYLNICPHFVY